MYNYQNLMGEPDQPDQLLSDKEDIPEELFHALATIIPRLTILVRETCDVTPIELLVLWHIRHFGRVTREDNTVISRTAITEMLQAEFGTTAPNVTKLIQGLQDKKLLDRVTLDSSESLAMGSKRRAVVILNQSGKQRVERFKSALQDRTIDLYKQLSLGERGLIRLLRPLAIKVAKGLISRYEPHRLSILYGIKSDDSSHPQF